MCKHVKEAQRQITPELALQGNDRFVNHVKLSGLNEHLTIKPIKETSPIIAEFIDKGEMKIERGRYTSRPTGEVPFFDEQIRTSTTQRI
ncbi:hypothetical protein GCM10023189_58290 [Nibrella saemangeumensis]|uniref:Uncharacterized protein n=1 Tax=Nibrella saemangeumensis TaxID=1084526 RepID=A0ABP8NSK7_9BACT